jgi:hypothetical protein
MLPQRCGTALTTILANLDNWLLQRAVLSCSLLGLHYDSWLLLGWPTQCFPPTNRTFEPQPCACLPAGTAAATYPPVILPGVSVSTRAQEALLHLSTLRVHHLGVALQHDLPGHDTQQHACNQLERCSHTSSHSELLALEARRQTLLAQKCCAVCAVSHLATQSCLLPAQQAAYQSTVCTALQ